MSSPPANVTGPVSLDRFTTDDLAELAREIAGSMFGYQPVIDRRGITLDQYREIAKNSFYVDMLRQSVVEFQRVETAQKRAKLKAAIAFEHAVPVMGMRIADAREPLEKVAQMAKVLADAAGIGGKEQQGGPQDRITISIDLGGDTKLVFDKAPTAIAEGSSQIRADAEGERDTAALPSLIEGALNAMEIRPLPAGEGTPPSSGPLGQGTGTKPVIQPQTETS